MKTLQWILMLSLTVSGLSRAASIEEIRGAGRELRLQFISEELSPTEKQEIFEQATHRFTAAEKLDVLGQILFEVRTMSGNEDFHPFLELGLELYEQVPSVEMSDSHLGPRPGLFVEAVLGRVLTLDRVDREFARRFVSSILQNPNTKPDLLQDFLLHHQGWMNHQASYAFFKDVHLMVLKHPHANDYLRGSVLAAMHLYDSENGQKTLRRQGATNAERMQVLAELKKGKLSEVERLTVSRLEKQLAADTEWQQAIQRMKEGKGRVLSELRQLLHRHRALLDASLYQSLLSKELTLREGEELYLEFLAALEERSLENEVLIRDLPYRNGVLDDFTVLSKAFPELSIDVQEKLWAFVIKETLKGRPRYEEIRSALVYEWLYSMTPSQKEAVMRSLLRLIESADNKTETSVIAILGAVEACRKPWNNLGPHFCEAIGDGATLRQAIIKNVRLSAETRKRAAHIGETQKIE